MDNPFKKIFDTASDLFKGSTNESVVGIDIGSSMIKIVEIKKKEGRAVLETYGALSLGPYAELDMGRVTNLPTEKIIEALKEVLKDSNVTTKNSALSIPVVSSLIFTIDLPANIKESEIDQIVKTEARKYIPLPITEISLDYFVLPKKEPTFAEAHNPDAQIVVSEKIEVLVVAIQNDAVLRYRSIVSGAEIETDFFEVEIFSAIRSNFEHELSPVLLIDLGASKTKLSIVEFGTVKSFHLINRGGGDISDSISKSLSIPFAKAEELKKEYGLFDNPAEKSLSEIIKVHMDYIISETNDVLLNYEKKYGRTVTKVVLTGGGALMKGIKEIMGNSFKAEVEIGRPFAKIGAPAFLDKVLEATGPEFAVALGLALRKLQ
jgi:type IV pilus assembly protein PilM